MKNTLSPFSRIYLSEVLGIKSYLCPKPIYNKRSFYGEIPCRFLVVVFHPLSFSQKELLRKIMASIAVFEFSILEVKDNQILHQLLSYKERLADFICFFGGLDLVKEGFLIHQKDRWVSSYHKSFLGGQPISFLQVESLEKLEGDSEAIRNKKRQVWKKLQEWKKLF